MQHDTQRITSHFWVPGDWVSATRFGSGHINDTYKVAVNQAGVKTNFLLQRINHLIFPRPDEMMKNVLLVTDHIKNKLRNAGERQVSRHTLTIIPARDGELCYRDAEGNYWRMYTFIENTSSFNEIGSEDQAYQAAKGFGEFQAYLEDMDASALYEIIKDFHHTPKRLENLKKAIKADAFNRVKLCQPEIDFITKREPAVGKLIDLYQKGLIPLRVTHNDTKINNILFDAQSKESLCVVDMDTVMPGLCLYDFGDMVRTATCEAPEDEKDLSKVVFRLSFFHALVKGFLEAVGHSLTPTEIENLPFSGRLITLTIGIRFLTDFLEGDHYFKTRYPDHNLHRCRTQLKLVENMENVDKEMQAIVNEIKTELNIGKKK